MKAVLRNQVTGELIHCLPFPVGNCWISDDKDLCKPGGYYLSREYRYDEATDKWEYINVVKKDMLYWDEIAYPIIAVTKNTVMDYETNLPVDLPVQIIANPYNEIIYRDWIKNPLEVLKVSNGLLVEVPADYRNLKLSNWSDGSTTIEFYSDSYIMEYDSIVMSEDDELINLKEYTLPKEFWGNYKVAKMPAQHSILLHSNFTGRRWIFLKEK